jgi:hypothetical protein
MSPGLMLHEPILHPSRAKYRRSSAKLFVPPLLPTLVAEPPAGPEREHEIKYDGYRTLIVLAYGERRANDTLELLGGPEQRRAQSRAHELLSQPYEHIALRGGLGARQARASRPVCKNPRAHP